MSEQRRGGFLSSVRPHLQFRSVCIHTDRNCRCGLETITPIENKVQPCKVHYDIWYLVLTDGANFNVDAKEFHETRWLTIDEAEKIVTDGPNRKALETIRKNYE